MPSTYVGRKLGRCVLLVTLAFFSRQQWSQASDLTGRWVGHWEDCRSGHSGPLRATFCKCDDTHYRVDFQGRFALIIPFRYSVTLTVTGQENDTVLLGGDSYLGRLFGTFTYSARATDTDFIADYSSCRYEGKFVLRRCCGK
jgi:hypothetical protein